MVTVVLLSHAQNALPDIVCALQVALEGAITAKAALTNLSKGEMPQGDLIPWTIGQQFQDPDFPGLSGARVVRIAVHPELQKAGYGARALELLRRYYQGELQGLGEGDDEGDDEDGTQGAKAGPGPGSEALANGAAAAGTLLTEHLKPRGGLPPLLVNLADRHAERLHYLGVSYGLTQQLFNFWHRGGYRPVYLRQSPSETTGEHTCVMLKPLEHPDVVGTGWLEPFVTDFKGRFMALLGGAFKSMPPALALSILDPRLNFSEADTQQGVQEGTTVVRVDGQPLTPYDLKRLQAYSSNLVDYHLILDLLTPLAACYLSGRLPTTLSYGQAAILLCLGLQQRELSDIEVALGLPSNQVLALFNKAIRKLYSQLRAAKEAAVDRLLPRVTQKPATAATANGATAAVDLDLDDELDAAAEAVRQQMRSQFKAEELQEYAVKGAEDEFATALGGGGGLGSGSIISLKSSAPATAGDSGGGKKKEAVASGGSQLYKKKQKQQGGKPQKKFKKQ
eukprot:jgi/Chrzof1/111/Cz01g03260.t1